MREQFQDLRVRVGKIETKLDLALYIMGAVALVVLGPLVQKIVGG